VLVLAGAGGLGAISGCAVYGKSPSSKPAARSDPSGGPRVLAQTSEIPVGGGKVFPDDNVVIVQPQQGTIKGFSATCTHQGCTVGDVSGGTINCPCHGSKYHVADGTVANGPAEKPLSPINLKVDGTSIELG
jgi:Rieske Fe-S protein